jgi:hypothetical protein
MCIAGNLIAGRLNKVIAEDHAGAVMRRLAPTGLPRSQQRLDEGEGRQRTPTSDAMTETISSQARFESARSARRRRYYMKRFQTASTIMRQ